VAKVDIEFVNPLMHFIICSYFSSLFSTAVDVVRLFSKSLDGNDLEIGISDVCFFFELPKSSSCLSCSDLLAP